MVREVVNIHIGQAGIQIANAAWELFCLEHGVKSDGHVPDEEVLSEDERDGRLTFFEHTPAEFHVPRAIFIDTEPTVIDEIRNGHYRQLFNRSKFISGKEDAANNYGRGYYTCGQSYILESMDQIRRSMECTNHAQGFFITNGQGGGTGAGFGSLLLEVLDDHGFEKTPKVVLAVFPSLRMSTAVVEPYNCVLNAAAIIKHADLAMLMDNEALYDVCKNKLDLDRPLYGNLNRVFSQVFSAVTAPLRFTSSLITELNQLQTNLVPYPRLKFPFARLAPLISYQRKSHVKLNTRIITKEVFHRSCQTVNCDTTKGRYMSISLLYRGPIVGCEAVQTIEEIRQFAADVRMVDWCPTGFKIGHCGQPMVTPGKSDFAAAPISACMIGNSTCMHEVMGRLNQKFKLLFTKRAFIYWYVGEGMEEGEFTEASVAADDIQRDYFEAGLPLE